MKSPVIKSIDFTGFNRERISVAGFLRLSFFDALMEMKSLRIKAPDSSFDKGEFSRP